MTFRLAVFFVSRLRESQTYVKVRTKEENHNKFTDIIIRVKELFCRQARVSEKLELG